MIAAIAIIFGISLAGTFFLVARAKDGYEDETGFHSGREKTESIPDREGESK